MANEDPNITVARFSYKQAIIVAAITASTTLGGTLLSSGSDSNGVDSEDVLACENENQQLKGSLAKSISFASLESIDSDRFSTDEGKEEVKNDIELLVDKIEQYEKERNHFTGKLFRLKKLMLSNGGNINVRIPSANPESCKLIQDLLMGIEYYNGSIDGNVAGTRAAVESFQMKLNQFTPGYFEEKNIGIVGRKTFNAILERYEKND
ncbi:MAG: peptidoglycan-binding domain-containing protein [Cyclobacteriaceae bacterium]